jgi:cell division protease FtsH
MADALVKFETIDDGQIKEIMDGRPPTPPAGWDDPVSSGPSGTAGPGARPAPGIGPAAGEGSAG